jgi:hypothetical protein
MLKYFPKYRKGKLCGSLFKENYVGPLFKTQELKGVYLSSYT